MKISWVENTFNVFEVYSFRGDICPVVFADICPGKETTWLNLASQW